MDYRLIIIDIVSLLFIALGVIMIFDARKLSDKWFSYVDKNHSTKIFKILGFIIAVLGSITIILTR